MGLSADLFWSFRSPYSYLATKRYRQLVDDYDLTISLRPVLPIAIREPSFFDKINPQWVSYLLRDCGRIAEFQQLPFGFPRPDPVNMDMTTRKISDDQPIIFWVTQMGVAASEAGKGLEFADEISSMIWGGVENWDSDDNLCAACERAGLDLDDLRATIGAQSSKLDKIIDANQTTLEKVGHWGVPTLAFNGEPFFGQDRIELAIWRMKQNGLERRG